MDKVLKRLTEIKKEQEEAKEKQLKLEGKIEELYKQMKEEFNVDDLDKAEKLIKECVKEVEEKEKELNKKLDKLDDYYGGVYG